MNQIEKKDPPKKSKKVKAVKVVKVGDPYYIFILKTEDKNIIDNTFISLRFNTTADIEHRQTLLAPMEKELCNIRNITKHHFIAEFPYDGYTKEVVEMLKQNEIDVILHYFEDGKVVEYRYDKVICELHEF